MTDALKGAVIALLNSVFVCLQAFDVPISSDQQAAVGGLANAVLLVYMLGAHRKTKSTV